MSHTTQGLYLTTSGDCTLACMLGMASPALAANHEVAAWGPQHRNGACASRRPGEELPVPQTLLGWVTQPEAKDDAGEKSKRQNQS